MSKEKFSPIPTNTREIYDVKTLSAQTKMRMVLEIFDLAKDKAKAEERKQNLLDLMSQYHRAVLSKSRDKKSIAGSDSERRKIHDQIMSIFDKISLSTGLNPSQRKLVDYLKSERYHVEEMIM